MHMLETWQLGLIIVITLLVGAWLNKMYQKNYVKHCCSDADCAATEACTSGYCKAKPAPAAAAPAPQ